jgi:hypothetical protein
MISQFHFLLADTSILNNSSESVECMQMHAGPALATLQKEIFDLKKRPLSCLVVRIQVITEHYVH